MIIRILKLPFMVLVYRSRSVVLYCLERWPCKAETAQQWWFEPNALSVVSGVTTLRLANLPEKHSVAYIYFCF